MSSNEPVKNGCEVIYEMFHILNCGFEINFKSIFEINFKSAVQYMKHFIYHFTDLSNNTFCFV